MIYRFLFDDGRFERRWDSMPMSESRSWYIFFSWLCWIWYSVERNSRSNFLFTVWLGPRVCYYTRMSNWRFTTVFVSPSPRSRAKAFGEEEEIRLFFCGGFVTRRCQVNKRTEMLPSHEFFQFSSHSPFLSQRLHKDVAMPFTSFLPSSLLQPQPKAHLPNPTLHHPTQNTLSNKCYLGTWQILASEEVTT